MPQQMPLLPGDPRRIGRYRLGGRITGIPSEDPIFIAIDPGGTEVVIGLLRGDWARDAAARDRFAAEAAVAKRVPPFCAARVLDAGLDGLGAYLVSEHIPGPSLLDVVAADGVRRGPDLEAVAIGMATGLASVHQAGLVHGNFGPEYVIMARDGPPRVVEFGITPPYGSATPSADMLAWAQTVVFAAAGRPPASLDDLDVLPEHIRGPVRHCLDPEPAERPAARAVVLSLLGGGPVPAGILAEGARRAARTATRGPDSPFPASPRQASPRPTVGTPRSGGAHGGSAHSASAHSGAQPPAARPQRYGEGRRLDDRPAGATASRHSQSGAPADHGHPARRGDRTRPRRGHRAGWLIAGVLVVIAAVAATVVPHLVQGKGSQSADGRLSANTGQARSRSASPSPSPSQGPVTPLAFAGSWTGLVRQLPTDTYNVRVTLTTGATSATVRYSGTDVNCSGTLSLTTADTASLTLSQGILRGQTKCESGTVTIALTSPTTMRFSFRSSGPIASGTLDRS